MGLPEPRSLRCYINYTSVKIKRSSWGRNHMPASTGLKLRTKRSFLSSCLAFQSSLSDSQWQNPIGSQLTREFVEYNSESQSKPSQRGCGAQGEWLYKSPKLITWNSGKAVEIVQVSLQMITALVETVCNCISASENCPVN